MYPHVLDDDALDNTKCWVMEDSTELPGDECDWKSELGSNKPRDSEMLTTYATGLLAITLSGGSQLVEDMLTSGLSAKLMRYLRKRVLGDTNFTPNDASFPVETKHVSVTTSVKVREENRGRSRQALDISRVDGEKAGDQGLLGEQSVKSDRDRSNSVKISDGEGCLRGGGDILMSDVTNSLPEVDGMYDVVEEDADLIGDGWRDTSFSDGMSKYFEKLASTRDADVDEDTRDDLSRRWAIRGWPRTRGKEVINEDNLENERALTSVCSGQRLGGVGRFFRDRSLPKNEDVQIVSDAKRNKIDGDDDRFRECSIGSRDISDMVKKATRAAEAEARPANAQPEAIKAAGDAAAELVKTVTLEVWKNTNDEEAAVLAASNAVSTVVDAAMGRFSRDRNLYIIVSDVKKDKIDLDGIITEEEDDDRFRECNIGSRDISEMVKKATSAAEAEARSANAPPEAIKAAGDAAAELVKTVALEAWKSTNDEEAAVLAASNAASTVVDAAMVIEASRNSSNNGEKPIVSEALELELDGELAEFVIPDEEQLVRHREKYSIRCLEILGEYFEALGPILHEKGVDVSLALLQRSFKDEETINNQALLPEVLKLICALAAHRKFAALFVDWGGMQKLLSVERASHTFSGLSSCLFTIGSLQGIMERICALPSDVVHQLIELALQLLGCPQDQARKNAAIFFANAFVFRAVLDSFDAQDGLQKMLNLLSGVAAIRSGGNSGILGVPNAILRNDQSPAEVLTAPEKQIAYHTCVALRQYFKAHLLLLVDSLRPNKSSRSIPRSTPSVRAAYKPLDISNESMDAVFLQIQRDRKLGPAFVRTPWPAVEKFFALNGHLTLLELSQGPPVDRYLNDLAQYALGVLHIVTFVPHSCKFIVNATLSNDRVGMAVILDAANIVGYADDPEVINSALNVLVNLVCPPPWISNKSSVSTLDQQPVPVHTPNGPTTESRERHPERNISDRTTPLPIQHEPRQPTMPDSGTVSQPTSTATPSGVVGGRRISLGTGPDCAGLTTQLEQGYRQAREAVRGNNGIKVLLHLLHARMIAPPATQDCMRALACRVLLGLARDDTIAYILTKLQVGKKLSELIRDSGSQASGTEQGKWQNQLAQVAIELIAIVTNSGRASTLAATDAAAPTLRRMERAAISSATPITYHSRELLLLIQEHLQLSGLTSTAALLQKEANLTPLPSLEAPTPYLHQASVKETPSLPTEWPSGRTACGFLLDASKTVPRDEDLGLKSESSSSSSRKKPPAFSSEISDALKIHTTLSGGPETQSLPSLRAQTDTELPPPNTPITFPMKRKLVELKDPHPASLEKWQAKAEVSSQSLMFQTSNPGHRNLLQMDGVRSSPTLHCTSSEPSGRTTISTIPIDNSDNIQYQCIPSATPTLLSDPQPVNLERMTLDSLVVQYLKHQHRQCPAPITTLPPLSLLHPHACPETSHSLDAPVNVTARVSTREFRKEYGGIRARRRDRQFVYSRFKPSRTCRDDGSLLSCLTFLGNSSRIATGCHSGELKIFDTNSGNVLESHSWHQSPVTLVQSAFSGVTQMVLSSGTSDVRLWDASVFSGGPLHVFEGCKAARFSHYGTMFAAVKAEVSRREVLLYDIQTYQVVNTFPESSNGSLGPLRGHSQSLVHFSPLDMMLLWNGVLWDRRSSTPVHRFDQFTDYGGGGFHPAGNEVIINSEVWDLRKLKLLRSVPSLDQAVITFNPGGDVIYAILRRNPDDITSAINTRRVRHPLFPAFRTLDAAAYSDISTVPVDRCVLDLAADPANSFVGVIAMDDEEMFSSARLFEIGRRRPTDDDSDPDDNENDDDDDKDDDEVGRGPILDADLESISLSSGSSHYDESEDDNGSMDGDINVDDMELEDFTSEGDVDSEAESFSSDEGEDFAGFGF